MLDPPPQPAKTTIDARSAAVTTLRSDIFIYQPPKCVNKTRCIVARQAMRHKRKARSRSRRPYAARVTSRLS